ncbi:hypothetical protein Leryth_010669 [Lithospermum erythrorhizon]|nr:hypothetical protein Leryth_010669 [Lithospermum erythrorhizon]
MGSGNNALPRRCWTLGGGGGMRRLFGGSPPSPAMSSSASEPGSPENLVVPRTRTNATTTNYTYLDKYLKKDGTFVAGAQVFLYVDRSDVVLVLSMQTSLPSDET